MSNIIEAGKTYKLVDASRDSGLQTILVEGYITFPDDKLVTISSVSVHPFTGMLVGYSKTAGLTSSDPSWGDEGIIAIVQASLDAGAFEEVADASRTTH